MLGGWHSSGEEVSQACALSAFPKPTVSPSVHGGDGERPPSWPSAPGPLNVEGGSEVKCEEDEQT